MTSSTSFLHKAAAIGMSILSPGKASAEMRKDAFADAKPVCKSYAFYTYDAETDDLGEELCSSRDIASFRNTVLEFLVQVPQDQHDQIMVCSKYSDGVFEFIPLDKLATIIRG